MTDMTQPAENPKRSTALSALRLAELQELAASMGIDTTKKRKGDLVAEIRQALEYGVGRIVLDSLEEIDRVAALARYDVVADDLPANDELVARRAAEAKRGGESLPYRTADDDTTGTRE